MRKFTFTLLMVLAFGVFSFGQYTASLMPQNVTASPNEIVPINLNVTGFNNIGSFQFYIQVDPAVLTYMNVTGFSHPGLPDVTVGVSGNAITVIWTSTTPHTWANGTLLTLNLRYNGLTSPIAFMPLACEVTSGLFVLSGTFTNTSISPFLGNVQKATLAKLPALAGSLVTVPLTYTGLPGTSASAITQRIAYDAGKLTYINVTGSGLLGSGINASASAGIITITWTNPGGALINTPGTQFNLNFLYAGSTDTAFVSFSTGCVITATTTNANIPVTYQYGGVALQVPPTAFASLGPPILTAVQGQMVEVPLMLSGPGMAGVDNFDIHLTYDNPRMSFHSFINPLLPGTYTTSSSGNTINLSYTNTADPLPPITGQFIVLRFVYNGVGTASINFASNCQFSIAENPVNVGYTNGSVSPAPATVNATIGTVAATSPSPVAIPVTFSDIPSGTSIGAVTMNIGFDASKLAYINAVNPYNATIDVNGNVISIAWLTTSTIDLNNIPFITLNFNYAAAGNATTLVVFKDGCQLANLAGTIVPTNWKDGGINTFFKISGVLSYDLPSGVLLDNVTVYIKDGPEPAPPNVTPVPNILYSTTTNAAGYYEINVPNGSYWIYAACNKMWQGADGGDVTQMRRLIAGLSHNINTPLRLLSANVDRSYAPNPIDAIDGTDVTALRRKIAGLTPNPNYKALDWLFDNPPVEVNGANVPNKNFTGLCSGDVNGSYPY